MSLQASGYALQFFSEFNYDMNIWLWMHVWIAIKNEYRSLFLLSWVGFEKEAGETNRTKSSKNNQFQRNDLRDS